MAASIANGRRRGFAAVAAATVIGVSSSASAIGDLALEGYYIVGPAAGVARVLSGGAARVCAPDVDALPGNLVHYKPPADEIARSLSVDFCEAALVDGAQIDAVLSDAAAMRLPVESKLLAATDGRTPVSDTTFAEAYAALSSGDPEAAATLFAQGLERDPDNYAAQYYLGSSYEQIGQTGYAAAQYRRVADGWPGTPEAAAAARGLERLDEGAGRVQLAQNAAASTEEDSNVFDDMVRSITSIFDSSPGDDAPAAPQPAPTRPAGAPPPSGQFEQAEIAYGDGARYRGEVSSDRPHGVGEMTYADGSRYAGGFRDGLRHGDGALTLTDGLAYQGQFVDDVIDGRGQLAWPDGSVYEGDFRSGSRTGQGSYRWPSGSRYEGRFDDGIIVGPGLFVSSDGARYEGEFQNGRRTGQGVLTTPDGGEIRGQFVDGRLVQPQ